MLEVNSSSIFLLTMKVRLYKGQCVHKRWPQTKAGVKTGNMVIVLDGPPPRTKVVVPFVDWRENSRVVDAETLKTH